MENKNYPANRLDLSFYREELPRGNRVALAQAITLAESTRSEDVASANQLIEQLLPHTGNSVRIGITGVPGVGKSTFIEALGKYLTSLNYKIAVLAIDPSSTKTKGSILGDKTRMEELARDKHAFIRPTATGNALGGVTDKTREAILLCEAAGYNVILIETVGVGQSETAVRNLSDFFLLLMLAGAGDELQGIKKGIMEMADAVVITKADGDNLKRANQAKADIQHALHIFSDSDSGWKPKVITSSASEKKGIQETWNLVQEYVRFAREKNFFDELRIRQNLIWFQERMQQLIKQQITESPELNEQIKILEKKIIDRKILPARAAQEIISNYFKI
ncbi:MAG: methylmalonyl Co-A mutase-associated GTPase MeaB [Cyclobacteriaceae bacterium]|nr:methylmalonyl Co-A mutase-associated GTPase MeaB [Cyclobacteriaceae bacterium]